MLAAYYSEVSDEFWRVSIGGFHFIKMWIPGVSNVGVIFFGKKCSEQMHVSAELTVKPEKGLHREFD